MYQLILNDGQSYVIDAPVTQTTASYKGTTIKAIKFTLTDTSIAAADIKTAFSDETATAELNIKFENGDVAATYTNYSVLCRIELDVETSKYTVTMGETSDIPTLITTLQEAVNAAASAAEAAQTTANSAVSAASTAQTAAETAQTTAANAQTAAESAQSTADTVTQTVADMTAEVDISTMEVADAKTYRIAESKAALEAYLAANPITSSCHGSTAKQYSVTSEKQQYLTQMIAICQLAAASEVEFTPSWNATGEECTYDWTLAELSQLSLEITAFVRPLVSAQQAYEAQINACTTTAEVVAIVIDYSTVATA